MIDAWRCCAARARRRIRTTAKTREALSSFTSVMLGSRMPIGTAKSKLVVALTLFGALAVGLTGASLLTRSRAALLQGLIERQNLLVQTRAHLLSDESRGLGTELQRLARLAD